MARAVESSGGLVKEEQIAVAARTGPSDYRQRPVEAVIGRSTSTKRDKIERWFLRR